MSNAPHKCPTCGVEVFVSMLGVRVEYTAALNNRSVVHVCPNKPVHLTVVPDEPEEKAPKAPAKKG